MIRIWSAPFALLNYAVIGWIMGRGQAVTALVIQVIGNGLNIVASIILVLSLQMGVVGAAFASVLAELVTACLGVLLVGRTIAYWPSARILDATQLRRMFRVNGDIFVRSLFLFMALALFTRIGTDFGPAVLAANAILLGIFQTSAAGLDGISAAAEQLVGHAVGARSRSAFLRAVRMSLVWGASTALVLAVLLMWGTEPLVAMSTKDPEVVMASAAYGFWVPIALLASALAYQMDGIFVGATWSKSMRNIMIASALVFAISAYSLSWYLGNHGLWAALVIFLLMRGVMAASHMKRRLATEMQPEKYNSA